MKKTFVNALVVVGLLATLSSCSKEDQADANSVKTSSILDDVDYINRGDGEIFYFDDSVTTYSQASKNYLLATTPLNLEKYKNGALLDSVCNKDIALVFESKARITQDKSALWGSVPRVASEHPPIVTVNTDDAVYSIKLSRMVTAFGLELNSPFKGFGYGVTVSFWNSKLNYKVPHANTLYLHGTTKYDTQFGDPGGAEMWGVKSEIPFDEIRIDFEERYETPGVGPFEISLAGLRYKLAK
jgi:hypothetical protein